jgi:hypothetical protein
MDESLDGWKGSLEDGRKELKKVLSLDLRTDGKME